MKRKGPLRHEILAACNEIGPEDGIDPRTNFRFARPRVPNRKALQLSAQVAETLQIVLAGECSDDLLRDLRVDGVRPAPHADHLVVTLTAPPDSPAHSEVAERLQRVTAFLRCEIAKAIHRRRVPRLSFHVVREGAGSS
jgi:ribosome-binding factor A